jgi:membrane fusion protein (multidrug efflux system)
MLKDAIVIPERAVTQQQATRLVLVVNDKGIVEPRPIQVGRRMEGGILVAGGLKGGERIIVDGLFKARPGSAVKPVPAKAAAAPGAAPAAGDGKAPAAPSADAKKK